MYYLFSPSIIWLVVFVGLFLFLNNKVNRLSRRLDETLGKRVGKEKTVSQATLSSVGVPLTPNPEKLAVAEASVPLTPAQGTSEKIDREEKGGQWLGKIGIAAIVLGVSFFLKWAFDNEIIGPMGRIILGIIGGIALVGVGQFLRKKYLVYSDIVSGGGIAILYLTVFAAFAFYHFIGSGVAFALMFAVTALSVTLSVLGGTQHLAALGVFGGVLTPLLMSTGENNFGGLMGYLVCLDVGILAVSAFKKWNRLNILGFLGTALLFSMWFTRFYTKEHLAVVFLLLTIFFLIYLVAGVIHNVLWRKDSSNTDLALITLNAAGYGFMSFVILNPEYHGVMGFFMLILTVLYFMAAFVAFRMNPADTVLNLYLPGIAVVFLTLAMPLQFSGLWITLAWFMEAALLTSAGSMVRRHSMNAFGIGVFVVGLVRFFAFDASVKDLAKHSAVFNSQFFLLIVAIAVAYLIGFLLFKHQGEGDEAGRRQGAAALFVVAHVLTLYMLTAEINTHYEKALYTSQKQYAVTQNDSFENSGVPLSERQRSELQKQQQVFSDSQSSARNRRNTIISIVLALYAAILTAVGFTAKRRLVRLLGLILFFVTAFKVLIDVWALGQLYRIISSISFGVIALIVSFAYSKWKHRLKEVL